MSNDKSIIQENHWILIRLPSNNQKLLRIKADELITLGKFGSFKSSLIIGKSYGPTYEILSENEIQPLDMDDIDIDDIEESEVSFGNKDLHDDNKAQKLSFDDIKDMKEKASTGEMKGTEIIQSIISNSDSFGKRSEFAKAKYLRKKKRKFLRFFTPVQPTVVELCKHFFEFSKPKIWFLRIDTLSQMLSYGNVHAGIKALTIDDTQGLMNSALIERMDGKGKIISLFGEKPGIDIVRYSNYSKEQEAIFGSMNWNTLDSNDEEVFLDEQIDDEDLEAKQRLTVKREKFEKKLERYRNMKNEMQDENFDLLMIASRDDPKSIIDRFQRYLGSSRPLVIYAPYQDMLIESYKFLRQSNSFINVKLTESWLRRYETLAGRIHPTMRTSATGGYILSAIKVNE